MPVCARCEKNIHPFSFRSFSKVTGQCNKCDLEIYEAFRDFRSAFYQFCSDDALTAEEMKALQQKAEASGIDYNQALEYIRSDALSFVEFTLERALSDGLLSPGEERCVQALIASLALPESSLSQVRAQVAEYKERVKQFELKSQREFEEAEDLRQRIAEIRQGRLPVITSTIYLPPDETCRLEVPAAYYRPTANIKPTLMQAMSEHLRTQAPDQAFGRIVVTDKKLRYVSPSKGIELDLRRIMRVEAQESCVLLELSIKKGNGFYVVGSPLLVEAFIETLVLKARGERPHENKKSAKTPKETPLGKTPYEVLGVSITSTREEVTTAYRHMAKMYHPDRVASLAPEFREIAERRMKEINAAYKSITD